MSNLFINGLTARQRRDLEEPDDPAQLSPLWDHEELTELGQALGIAPVPIRNAGSELNTGNDSHSG